MFRNLINKFICNIFQYKSEIKNFKYRLKGYRYLISFGDVESEVLKLKVLPIYSYLEMHRRRNAFYSFLYSLILVASVVTLI